MSLLGAFPDYRARLSNCFIIGAALQKKFATLASVK